MIYPFSRPLVFASTLALVLLIPATFSLCAAEVKGEEQQLLQILESNQSLQEKDAACARLKRIGTAESVSALSRLLTDENLSHSARYALESMPFVEAGKALTDALPMTSGLVKVGIIDSLGNRAEKSAVKPLSAELKGPDDSVAVAAAGALGRIGGVEVQREFLLTLGSAKGTVLHAVAVAALHCAEQLRIAGSNAEAKRLFQEVYTHAQVEGDKVAAYRGIILSSGNEGVALTTDAILTTQDARQLAALQLVHELKIPGTTEALAGLLPKVGPVVQVAVIEGLGQRKDPKAAPAVAALAGAENPQVRLAALQALGKIGNAQFAGVLTAAAAKSSGSEQVAARQALVDLPGNGVKEALLIQLGSADPKIRAEAALALGQRSESGAVPQLLELARTGTGTSRQSALLALSTLASQKDLEAMVLLVADSRTQEDRTTAAEALNTVYQRLKTRAGQVDPQALVSAIKSGAPEVRMALLPVCSGLSDPNSAEVLTQAINDNHPGVRAAGIRALSDSVNPQLLSTIGRLARELPEDNLRSIALAGYVRLATDEASASVPVANKVEGFEQILTSRLSADQLRMLLAGLGQIPDVRGVKLVEPLLKNEAVRAEAGRALLKIAPGIVDTEVAIAALKQLIDTPGMDAEMRKSAQAALDTLEARADYLVAWQASGPYRKANTDFAGLFDTVFPPETGTADQAKWATVPSANDPAKPGVMDLLKAFGGEQCVAYVRTWIFSPNQREAVLDMGSDDGLKVWINDKIVHANNTARPLQPGSDKAKVELKEGWNRLMIKVTQNNLGWEFCARFLKPDGTRLKGLKSGVEKQ